VARTRREPAPFDNSSLNVSTIAPTLTRHQLVTPEPKNRPKSSYIRFQAEQPNEAWQADFTHYRLATNVGVEILAWLYDRSTYAVSVTGPSRRRLRSSLNSRNPKYAIDAAVPATKMINNASKKSKVLGLKTLGTILSNIEPRNDIAPSTATRSAA
jgi:hypothetical protein